jgi:hypothetical protein
VSSSGRSISFPYDNDSLASRQKCYVYVGLTKREDMRYQSAEDAPSATKPTHTVYVRSHDTSVRSTETIVARDRDTRVGSEATPVSPVSETVRDLPCRAARTEVRVRTSGGGGRPGVDCRAGLRATRDSDEPRGRIAKGVGGRVHTSEGISAKNGKSVHCPAGQDSRKTVKVQAISLVDDGRGTLRRVRSLKVCMEVMMEVRWDRVVGPWAGAGAEVHTGSRRCGWRQHARSTPFG